MAVSWLCNNYALFFPKVILNGKYISRDKKVQVLLLFMENILHQNFFNIYPFLVKTRRNIALKKMYQNPIVFNYMCTRFLNTENFLQTLKYITPFKLLKFYYIDLNVWYFFKHIFFKNQGIYVNNSNLSYTYWTLQSNITQLTLKNSQSWPHLNKFNNVALLKNTRIVSFSLSKISFNKVTFLILFLLLEPFTNFLKTINITYSFLFVPSKINFFIFYSYFYFRVYNF